LAISKHRIVAFISVFYLQNSQVCLQEKQIKIYVGIKMVEKTALPPKN